jgi:hypothetical protein
MRYPFWQFLLVVILPLIGTLFITIYLYQKFDSVSETFSRVEVFEERAVKVRSGEISLTREEVADLYLTMAKSDLTLSQGLRLTANSLLFWMFGLVAIVIFQTMTLRAVYKNVVAKNEL